MEERDSDDMDVEGTNDLSFEDYKKLANSILREGVKNQQAQLTSLQLEALQRLLTKKRTLLVEKTGGGKSAIYFIATKLLRKENKQFGPTIVICPLISLMNDQVASAEKFGLQAEAFNSSLNEVKKSKVIRQIRQNTLDIVYLSAEMLSGPNFVRNFMQFNPAHKPTEADNCWTTIPLVVIDEAHCVSDWGHDFRPQYFFGLKAVFKEPWIKRSTMLATSATINNRVEEDLLKILPEKWDSLRGFLYRENLAIRVAKNVDTKATRKEWLRSFFKKHTNKNVLIFVFSRKDSEEFCKFLQEENINAKAYHAKLENRAEIEKDFKQGKIKVLVSTIALGMGYDKPDLDFVIHLFTPSSVLEYYQQIGRAGRDTNNKATAYLLPTKPWRSDEKWREALQIILRHLEKCENQEDETRNIEEILLSRNYKEADGKTAIEFATKLKLIEESNRTLKRLSSAAMDVEYVERRKEETEFMNRFRSAESCLWKQMLCAFGAQQQVPDTWKCNNCTFCCPSAITDVFYNPEKAEDVCYRTTTPEGLEVYAIGINDDNVALSDEVVRKILQDYVGFVRLDPPAWCLTYVPNMPTNTNMDLATTLAEELNLSIFHYLEGKPKAKSMTAANNTVARMEVIKTKFKIQTQKIPKDIQGVILFDDAMKSGTTLDFVSKPLIDAGKKVIAIVTKLWTLPEHPPPETLLLE